MAIQPNRRSGSAPPPYQSIYFIVHPNGAWRCLHGLESIAPGETQIPKRQRWQIQKHLFWEGCYDAHQDLCAHYFSIVN